MTRFETNRAGLFKVLILAASVFPIVIFIIDSESIFENPLIYLPALAPVAILLWVYFDTYYIVMENRLRYKSAFIKGEIDIQSIREIMKGKTSWIGLRPATATNGLIIKFNTYDEIYISPKDNEAFITMLKQINSSIQITE